MIDILIVSLAKDFERREKINTSLASITGSYKYIDAVVGKELTQEFVDRLPVSFVEKRKKRIVVRSEIGCTLSHIKIFQYIVDNNLPVACVLEDDVILDTKFINFISKIDAEDFSGVEEDVFILGGQDGIDKTKFIAKSFWFKKELGGFIFDRVMSSEANVLRACSYIISNKLARKMLNLFDREYFLADEWGYFKKTKSIRNIYLSGFVHHPIDLSNSHLEQDRVSAYSRYSNEVDSNISFRKRMKKIAIVRETYRKLKDLNSTVITLIRRLYVF